ncbi:MAG TPA: glycosyltransferase [Longimicrobiales bacterium]|nr:glycosyltransferase [Longimicrobiales bacterium]
MTTIALWIVALALVLLGYAYAGYPLLLWLAGVVRGREAVAVAPGAGHWPLVSISVAAYNEEAQIRELIKSLLAIEYPRDRLQILITSDGSTDATDAIVSEYADQGVELLRMPERSGKTKAENAASERLRGEIIVNTDASTRILPHSLEPLIAAMRDPRVGCASGRDVSVSAGGAAASEANIGESGYVGYEMAVRDLETRVSGIIGASGCFYAIRADLHRLPLPGTLSRDFAAALKAEEHGYRAVSVPAATCLVPRGASLRKEYRRKVRTIARGMRTLWHKRALLNPLRHPVFAWMLLSHKVSRWMLPWAAGVALLALGVLAVGAPELLWPRVLLALALVVLALGAVGWMLADRPELPRILAAPAFLVAGNVAAAHALLRVLAGGEDALWEPTRREVVRAG